MKKTFLLLQLCFFFACANAQNVGIGTTTPTTKLTVKQDIANRGIMWQHETLTDSWTVGIGTNTLNCRFEFNGVLRGQISSVDGTYITGSDMRYKEAIEVVPDVLSRTLQLKPFSYYYKDSRQFAQHRSIGFIAQEVEKLFPEMVYDIDGGYKGINYAGFAVVAIKAVQEQQEKIASLEARLQKLEAKLDALNK
ncbi:MAG: tail fiber domain-containing protein [Chitinophagaceae bacterium]